MNSVAFFRWLISVVGTKLPQVWPEILTIVAAVQAIAAKLAMHEAMRGADSLSAEVSASDVAGAEAAFADLDSKLAA